MAKFLNKENRDFVAQFPIERRRIDFYVESEKFKEKLIENLEQFNILSEELKSKKISLVEYIFKWGQILNSKSK